MTTLLELKKEALDEMYKLGLYRLRNASRVYAFFDMLFDGVAQVERDRCARIVGAHESPHTPANCKLCKIEGGL